MIEPEKAQRFSDPFDRATLITSQLRQVIDKLDALDLKVDAYNARLYVVESDGKITRLLSSTAIGLSALSLVIALAALVLALR